LLLCYFCFGLFDIYWDWLCSYVLSSQQINVHTHPGELAIVRPDGEYFFVAQRVLGSTRVNAIPSEIFRGILALQLLPKTFVAHRWRAGAPDFELVFSMAGKYKVILGEPLESNIASKTEDCEVILTK
jgi:hypothetical protein